MADVVVAERPVVSTDFMPALSPRPPRNQTLDAARGLAGIGVIWVHTVIDSPDLTRSASLARFGTPFFVLAALFFLLTGLSTKASARWDASAVPRVTRLYIPFRGWRSVSLPV